MVPGWRRAPAGRAKREGKRIYPHPISLPQGRESRGGSQEGKRHTTPLSTLSTARPLPRSRKLLQDRGPSRRVGRLTGKVPHSGETSPGGKHTCPRSEKEREQNGGIRPGAGHAEAARAQVSKGRQQRDDCGGLACSAGSVDGASHDPSPPPETGGVALELREVRDGPLRDSRRLTHLPHPRNREGKSTHGLHDKEACRLPGCVMQKQTVIARGSKLGPALCLVWNQKPRNSHKTSRRTSRSKCNIRRSETARKRRTGLSVNTS